MLLSGAGLLWRDFIERYRQLKQAFQSCLDSLSLGRGVTVLDLGHAFYVEVGEGDESTDPIRWLREVRSRIPEEYGSVDVRVVEQGNAAAGIVKETRQDDIDLVAMATHGRGGVRRVMLGTADAHGLYERFGFVPEGRHRAYALRDGAYVDCLSMARLHPNPPRLPE